ncbi:MAG: RHS repeat protein [Burkholderiales bacterium]|nr:RHS repeat protein [Burkholderiales bacterium]
MYFQQCSNSSALLRLAFFLLIQFGLVFQASSAERAKSPIPPERKIIGWDYGPNVLLPNAIDACRRYEQESQILNNGYRFYDLVPNAGSRPDHETYDCMYEVVNSPGYVVGILSIGAHYDETCTSPYVKEGTQCVLPPDKNKDCPCIGNPINFATGNKRQTEIDYRSVVGGLEFVRNYSSERPSKYLRNFTGADVRDPAPGIATRAPGTGWQHNFHKNIIFQTIAPVATISRSNGEVMAFALNGGIWKSDADVNASLVKNGANWVLTTSDDDIETYNDKGRLMSVRTRAGVVQTLSYNLQNLLETVADSFGRQLSFAYDSELRLQQLTVPDGGKYVYGYDANNNLVSVTYPDLKIRRYVYEDGRFPNSLTGIMDEKWRPICDLAI